MNIQETILQEIKNAMKAKETKKRDALRLLTSAFKQVEVDKRITLSDSDVIEIIQQQIKRRNDSLAQYKKANREDLAEIEAQEIAFYTPYLPQQLSDEALQQKIVQLIKELNASSMKDMKKVMTQASQKFSGQVDGKRLSSCIKGLLH